MLQFKQKKPRKEIQISSQTQIFYSLYLCNLMVKTDDIFNLDYSS